MNLLKWIEQASPFRGMPVDDKNASSSIQTITGEVVQLYYYAAGVRTADAGEAIGTLTVGQLTFDNIKNQGGYMEATPEDTSLGFTSTALTTEVVFYPPQWEYTDEFSEEDRLTAIGATLSDGEFMVDYSSGTIYAKKASTTFTLTATTFKIKSQQVGSGGGVTGNVNLDEVGGIATAVDSGVANTGTQRVTIATDDVVTVSVGAAGTPEAQGIDATGQDAYATVITPTADAKHMMVTNEGAEGAIISIDAGVTDQFTVIGGAIITFDDVDISSAVAIQAKNQNAGSNYTDLAITIW